MCNAVDSRCCNRKKKQNSRHMVWLSSDSTRGEEYHEVPLLWRTADAMVLQEEVRWCLHFLWAWGSLSRHDILTGECAVGCWCTELFKLTPPLRWGIAEDSAWSSDSKPQMTGLDPELGKWVMCRNHQTFFFFFLFVFNSVFTTTIPSLYTVGQKSI